MKAAATRAESKPMASSCLATGRKLVLNLSRLAIAWATLARSASSCSTSCRPLAAVWICASVAVQASFALPTSTAFSYWMIMSFSCERSVLIAVRSWAM